MVELVFVDRAARVEFVRVCRTGKLQPVGVPDDGAVHGEVGAEVVQDPGAARDALVRLHRDLPVTKPDVGHNAERVNTTTQAGAREDDAPALERRRDVQEVVLRRLRFLRGTPKAVGIEHDKGGGTPGVVHTASIDFGAPVTIKVGDTQVIQMTGMPILGQYAPING